MTRRNDISQELQEISPGLAHLEPVNPYRVPAGYFESFAELILLRIRTEHVESAADEMQIVSPLLSGLKKEMPFSVPAGYFEKLARDVVVPVPAKKQAKVISMQPRKVFGYAAAAVTAGLIILLGFLYIKEPAKKEVGYAATENVTESQVIENINTLSETEIADFVEKGSNVYSIENSTGTGEIAGADVQLMLADISDNELEGYLETNIPGKEKFN